MLMAASSRSGGLLDALTIKSSTSTSGGAAGSVRELIAAGIFPRDLPLTLLIDYDGTLVPYAPTPEQAAPDAELMRLLESLAAAERIDLHLVSGRAVGDLTRWFGSLDAHLWAEHGAAHRRSPDDAWRFLVDEPPPWMTIAEPYLRDLTARARGSLLERKRTSLAWHYRLVDPDLAERQVSILDDTLPRILSGHAVNILRGHMVCEVRPQGISKGLAVRYVLETGDESGVIVAIGDDRTDEEMFAALPPSGIAIRVGGGTTGAQYGLADFRAVRRLLAHAT
jgi:trehalose 6-phosphate synthase/phosphatase